MTPPAGIVRDSRGARASKDIPSRDAPHIKIGDVVIRHVDGDGLNQRKMMAAIQEEAQARGATALVYTHCDPTLECEAALFRLSKDVDASLRPKAPPSEADLAAAVAENDAAENTTPGDTDGAYKGAPSAILSDTIDGTPAVDPRWIADNPGLMKAIVGLWTPDKSGSIPASADKAFEKELLRSRLYINAGKPSPPKHEGNLIVYTDSASLVAVDGATSKPYGLPPGEIFQLALDMKMGIYLHYEGSASVFHVIEQDELRGFIARLAKKP